MSQILKILTFNHHESYICSLALTGHQFDVVVSYKTLSLPWPKNSRTVPLNVRLIAFDESVKKNLRAGCYDVVILHTVKNLAWLFPFFSQKFVFIAHIPLFSYTLPLYFKSLCKVFLLKIFSKTHKLQCVSVSPFKNWGLLGTKEILLLPCEMPALNVDWDKPKVLVIANQIRNRSFELGLSWLEELRKNFPLLTIIGNNPGVDFSYKPQSYQEFLETIRTFGVYFYTIQRPFGDGYNTALLEAMKMGMAIVTLPNPSSPIVHGVNGKVVHTLEEAKAAFEDLFAHPEDAIRLGQEAQKTVEHHFSQKSFVTKWNEVFASEAR